MSKKNIVIAGGGFAGLSALRRLSGFKKSSLTDFNLVLIDRKDAFEFLPMLPDVTGGWLDPEGLRSDLKKACNSQRCEFIKDEVTGIDIARRKITFSNSSLDYEYLLISSGSETNFFSSSNERPGVYKLDNVDDAIKIRKALLKRVEEAPPVNIVIVGGGYTGIEIATNINYLLGRRGANHRIFILERANDILTMVPGWIRDEVRKELMKLNIEIISGDSLKEYDGETVFLESGEKKEHAFCIWAAGVKTPSFVDKIEAEKERTRIKVTEELWMKNAQDKNVFVAGDASAFFDERAKNFLRMAVMFSIGQGKVAAANIGNTVLKKPLIKYRPIDLGYLIPMAHGKAPGVVMARRIHGSLGYLMHYFMCIYRSETINKMRVVRDLLKKQYGKKGGV